jgi:hypothetical protein
VSKQKTAKLFRNGRSQAVLNPFQALVERYLVLFPVAVGDVDPIYRSLDQSIYTSSLSHGPERERRDLWWIDQDGRNVADVVENLLLCFLDQGLPWFRENSDIEHVFAIVEGETDCLVKYQAASAFAQHIGNAEKHEHYKRLADAESRRIDELFAPFNRRRKQR